MSKSSSKFQHNNPFTIGVEEEYMLCSPETGNLINRADGIMNSITDDIRARYSYELILSEVEINTSVCKTVAAAMEEIIFLRNNTKKLGETLEYRIGISGTHPTAICKDQKFVKNKSYQWVADQLNYYAKRNVTFATHVHIAVDEKYSSKGTQTDKFLVFRIINELKKIIMRIKGINTITIKYGQNLVINLKRV